MEEKQDVKYASFSTRLLAVAIDFTIIAFLLTPVVPSVNSFLVSGLDLEQFIISGTNRIDMSAMFSYLSNKNFFIKYFLVQLLTVMFIVGLFLLSWIKIGSTIGKWILGCKIVDAQTLAIPSRAQYVKRAGGYFVSGIPFCLGFFAMNWSDKSQCWHDRIAATVVVKVKHDFSWLKKFHNYINDLMKRKFVR